MVVVVAAVVVVVPLRFVLAMGDFDSPRWLVGPGSLQTNKQTNEPS